MQKNKQINKHMLSTEDKKRENKQLSTEDENKSYVCNLLKTYLV